MEHALADKDTAMRESHHRIKNNLNILGSLLSLQSHRMSSEEARRALMDSESRVRVIGTLHDILHGSSTISRIELGSFLRQIAEAVRSIYQPLMPNVTLECSIDGFTLDNDRAIPCGLILNELLTNAYKYAFPAGRAGRITVSSSENGPVFSLSVRDNGVGLHVGVDPEKTASMGLSIVSSLAVQMGGELRIERARGTGVTVSFAP